MDIKIKPTALSRFTVAFVTFWISFTLISLFLWLIGVFVESEILLLNCALATFTAIIYSYWFVVIFTTDSLNIRYIKFGIPTTDNIKFSDLDSFSVAFSPIILMPNLFRPILILDVKKHNSIIIALPVYNRTQISTISDILSSRLKNYST